MLIPFGILSAAGAGGGAAASDYELIETYILGSSQSSITFDVSTYASTYKHLQVRIAGRGTGAGVLDYVGVRLNSDTGTNYSHHIIYGQGTGVFSSAATNANRAVLGIMAGNDNTANSFGATVIDFLDAFSTTKNKTMRSLSGVGATEVNAWSGNWRNTNAITSINIFESDGGNLAANSRFSIYGIKG